MKQFLLRLIRLMSGYFIYAIGIVFCLQGNLGYSPWDILNNGFSLLTGCSLDAASIPIGFFCSWYRCYANRKSVSIP